MISKRVAGLFVAAALASGCGRGGTPAVPSSPAAAGPSNAPAEKSTAATVIDGFTGKTAVDAGRRAAATLRDASQKEHKDLDEALQQ